MDLRLTPPTGTPEPTPIPGRAAARRLCDRRAVVADDGRSAGNWLGGALASLGVKVRHVRSGQELKQALSTDSPFDLVVSAANLVDQTGLCALAEARALGIATPFLVLVATHQRRLRVLVSLSDGDVLSSRVLDQRNLIALASELIVRTSVPTA